MTYQPHQSEDTTLKPVADETDAPRPPKESPDVWCPCEPHPMATATQPRAADVMASDGGKP